MTSTSKMQIDSSTTVIFLHLRWSIKNNFRRYKNKISSSLHLKLKPEIEKQKNVFILL